MKVALTKFANFLSYLTDCHRLSSCLLHIGVPENFPPRKSEEGITEVDVHREKSDNASFLS